MPDTTTLPPVIRQFIAAMNGFDGPALLDCFTEDALVYDNHREFWGKPAIKAFADRELIGDKVTMAVTAIRKHYDQYIVAALIDGTYDKTNLPDPLILTFYFTPHGEKLATLMIVFNKA